MKFFSFYQMLGISANLHKILNEFRQTSATISRNNLHDINHGRQPIPLSYGLPDSQVPTLTTHTSNAPFAVTLQLPATLVNQHISTPSTTSTRYPSSMQHHGYLAPVSHQNLPSFFQAYNNTTYEGGSNNSIMVAQLRQPCYRPLFRKLFPKIRAIKNFGSTKHCQKTRL